MILPFFLALCVGLLGAETVFDFEEFTQEYVTQYAASIGHTVKWWDLYAQHPEITKYPQDRKYHISTAVDEVSYGSTTKDVRSPGFVYTQWYHNGGSTDITSDFKKQTTLTASYTWSIETGFKVGVNTEVKAGVPEVFDASVGFTSELSTSATESDTQTKQDTFCVHDTITIPKNRSVKAEFVVTDRSMDIEWSADVEVTGWLAIWLNEKYNDHWLWFHPVSLLTKYQTADCPVKNYGSALKYRASGLFSGVRGVDYDLTVTEYPLNADENTPPLAQTTRKPLTAKYGTC